MATLTVKYLQELLLIVKERRAKWEQRQDNATIYRDHYCLVQATVDHLFSKGLRGLSSRRRDRERYESRDECVNEAWAFLFGDKGQSMLQKAESTFDPEGYKWRAIYRCVLLYANNKYGLGKRNRHRPTFSQLEEDPPDPTTARIERECEFALLLDDLQEDVRAYLRDKLYLLTDTEIKQAHGWTRTYFDWIRGQAHLWIAQNCAEVMGAYLNAVTCPDQLKMMQDVYRLDANKDRGCSVLFVPDKGKWVLWGPVSEVVGRSLNRPVGPGPRLCLDADSSTDLFALEQYATAYDDLRSTGQPRDQFWLYSGF